MTKFLMLELAEVVQGCCELRELQSTDINSLQAGRNWRLSPGHQHPMAKTGIGADVWKLIAEKLSGDCAVHGGEGTTDCVLMPRPGAKPDLLPGPSRGIG